MCHGRLPFVDTIILTRIDPVMAWRLQQNCTASTKTEKIYTGMQPPSPEEYEQFSYLPKYSPHAKNSYMYTYVLF